MKVLHCPTDTGGNAWGLSRAERELGIESDVMVRRSSWTAMPADVDLHLREGFLPVRLLRLLVFFAKAVRTYDVFHFNWGMSLLDHRQWNLNYLELPFLKKYGKRIVVTFQGCDARMKGRSQQLFSTSACATCDVAWCTPRLDGIRQRRTHKLFKYADRVFALNPDLLHVLPGAEFLPYASVDPRAWLVSPAQGGERHGGPVRILHMPTNRSIKGTRYVEAACEELKRQGFNVELVLIEQVPHHQVKALIAQADLVVDQLLIGWYGALAVEAMAMGKPVLCYLRDEDLKLFVPFHERIPIVRTTKDTLAHDLARLLRNRSDWPGIGLAGRQFVQDCHDPLKIARQTIAAYQGGPSPLTTRSAAEHTSGALAG
jgi:glycosyltransferase involved in cell wall biosynthesis